MTATVIKTYTINGLTFPLVELHQPINIRFVPQWKLLKMDTAEARAELVRREAIINGAR